MLARGRPLSHSDLRWGNNANADAGALAQADYFCFCFCLEYSQRCEGDAGHDAMRCVYQKQ